MSQIKTMLTSSLGRKLVMSLTGIFLIVFLIEHLIGNATLLLFDDGKAFNEYAHFMKETLIIQISEFGLFGGIILHVIQGILLVKSNAQARPTAYAAPNKARVDNWASKYMGPFGFVILVFLVVHLWQFFTYKNEWFGHVPTTDAQGNADMWKVVVTQFQDPITVVFYVIAMIVTMFHLNHGFASAFQTLGINNKAYSPIIRGLGKAYSILIPLGLAAIPVIIFIAG